MNYIKSISFKNYKAFGNEETTIKIKPITIFIGKNSSGKSSILKLISVLSNLTQGDSSSSMLLNNNYVTLGGRYEDLFHNNETTSLSIGIEYESGIKITAEYYVDKGDIFVYQYKLDKDQEKKEWSCKPDENVNFKGLINEGYFENFNLDKEKLRFNVSYIGPFRVQPERNIQVFTDKPSDYVGVKGENTYSILLKSYLSEEKELFKNVSNWLDKNLEGQKISFERNSPTSGTYSLYVKHGDANVNISDVGQGTGQIIPIITQSFINNKSDMLIVEQPALHLHPAAHAEIAYQLMNSVANFKKKCIIETHSENVILGIRKMIARRETSLKADDVIIYFIDSDGTESTVQEITIDKLGQLSTWPEGIFSESFDLLGEIMNL